MKTNVPDYIPFTKKQLEALKLFLKKEGLPYNIVEARFYLRSRSIETRKKWSDAWNGWSTSWTIMVFPTNPAWRNGN